MFTTNLANPLPDIKMIAITKNICPTGALIESINVALPLTIETKNKQYIYIYIFIYIYIYIHYLYMYIYSLHYFREIYLLYFFLVFLQLTNILCH